MRRKLLAGLACLALLATAATAPPVTAQTAVTVTLNAGSLSLTEPGSASASGSVAPGTSIGMTMGTTTVTDNRGSLLGWATTAVGSDLTFGAADSTRTVPKAGMTWATGTVATSNGALTSVTAGAGGSLAGTVPVATAASSFGSGTFTYPATVTVVVPANVRSGAYTGTLTQTIS